MNKVRLSADQRAMAVRFRDTFTDRPTFGEYQKVERAMRKLGPKKKPKDIPNTLPGYERSEVKLTADFDASKDLPEGWAVYDMHDSGGNHSIVLAGPLVLMQMWNNWERRAAVGV